jgi:hypothetical protein
MKEFSGSWDGFEMLRRLVFRGSMRNFNRSIAAELIAAGLARIDGEALVATKLGIQTERSVKLPRPPLAA